MSETVMGNSKKVSFFWRPQVLLMGLLLLQLCLYFSTYQSMVEIWWRSETFAHGFFIAPISVYLIWKKRSQLAAVAAQSDFRALLLLLTMAFLWLIAKTVDVLVIEQFSAVMMLPLLVWLVQGKKYATVIAFPLSFLLFAVPFGDFLVYPLMEFTAVFTVNAIRLTGIPVFWEGLYFSLPSGSWSVVEACSGFRYILASLTLGALYAYLTYYSFWRRAGFMVLALVVPIVANGLRAFMIVMIGHFSGMELAVGVDHLIYGWVWFGIVMFIMFWIGSFWQQKLPVQGREQTVVGNTGQVNNLKRTGIVIFCASLLLLTPVLFLQKINAEDSTARHISLPQQFGDWHHQSHQLSVWQPQYHGASQQLAEVYTQLESKVGVYIAYFGSQQQGVELVNSSHRLISDEQKGLGWKEVSRISRAISFGETNVDLKELQIKSPKQSLLVWQWNYLNGFHTDNDFFLKALEAWAKLTGKSRNGVAIVVYVEQDDLSKNDRKQAAKKLQVMVSELLPKLESELK